MFINQTIGTILQLFIWLIIIIKRRLLHCDRSNNNYIIS